MKTTLSSGATVFVPRPEAAGVADAMIEAVVTACLVIFALIEGVLWGMPLS